MSKYVTNGQARNSVAGDASHSLTQSLLCFSQEKKQMSEQVTERQFDSAFLVENPADPKTVPPMVNGCQYVSTHLFFLSDCSLELTNSTVYVQVPD
jgi:hypothetical protein